MFLQTSNKPVRLTTAAKARLNTHNHKIDNIETRKRSPEGYPGPPSPSSSNDLMVFTNSHQVSGRSGHNSRCLPEYPNIDEMHRYLQDGIFENCAPVDDISRYLVPFICGSIASPVDFKCIFGSVWDQKIKELNDPNSKLKYLNLGKPNEKNYRKEGSPTVSQPATPVKQRSSPQHQHNNKRF